MDYEELIISVTVENGLVGCDASFEFEFEADAWRDLNDREQKELIWKTIMESNDIVVSYEEKSTT